MNEIQAPTKENGQKKQPAPRLRDPWTMFEDFWSDLDLDLDRFSMLRPRIPRLRLRAEGPIQVWRPDIDVLQRDGKLVVKADLPGMKKEDVEVLLEEGKLVIKGERLEESKIEEEDYFRAERSHGSFYRGIPLPPEIDESMIAAQFKDGVLEVKVTLPQEPAKDRKQIAIS